MPATATKLIRVHQMEALICSQAMFTLMSTIARVAPGNMAVLITGETGTGKELLARAIHSHSLRASSPWVDINCAALPEHLVESELFGYEKGAFSGAHGSKPGLFELADQGSLFLDEVGELERTTQTKLLRVLDGFPFYRLGGSRKVSVDVRIIAATNQWLESAVKAGKFRSDLYHRLSQFRLRVPPLRERPEDIAALAEYFLKKDNRVLRLSPAAIDAMQGYSWPGNVRELRNALLQATSMVTGDEIKPEDLPIEICSGRNMSVGGIETTAPELKEPSPLDVVEKQAILRALSQSSGNQRLAAKQLGISSRTLSRKLKQYYATGAPPNSRFLQKREEPNVRASLAVPVSIISPYGEQRVQCVNVSPGGIGVEDLKRPFELAGGITVAFSIPGQNEAIHARAQLAWADTIGRAGLRFTAIEKDYAARLKALVQEAPPDSAGDSGVHYREQITPGQM
jgi:two-component system, NtrC family, response regulator AtoC